MSERSSGAGRGLPNDLPDEPPNEHGARGLLRICERHELLTRLGDKWAVLVLHALATAPGRRLRFSAVRRRIEGVTPRMLTVTLRDLERDGLVARHYFAEVPPRVEYELSELGAGMLHALEAFAQRSCSSWPHGWGPSTSTPSSGPSS